MPDPHLNRLGPCPDLSLVASYVDGQLGAPERALLQRHLASCDSCTELVAEMVETAEGDGVAAPAAPAPIERDAPPRLLLFRRKPVTAAVSILAAAAALALVVRVWNPLERAPGNAGTPDTAHRATTEPAITGLVAALGPARTVEGRLTGGFQYGGLRTPDRGADASSNLALMAAAGQVQKQAEESPTPANLHAWGVAQLVVGRYDGAVETLESVWVQPRPAARVAADLGVARLARADATGASEDLPRALEAVEQAITLDPNLPEAWFTKAIVLERLQIRQQARDAWVRYLELDPSSPWSEEARRRLAALESPAARRSWQEIERALIEPATAAAVVADAVARDATEVRELVIRELLPGWARAEGRGEGEAALQQVARVVDPLEAASPDRSLGRVLQEIRQASSAGRAAVARGVLELSAGLEAQRAERPAAEAEAHVESAVKQLRAAQSSLEMWAEVASMRLAAVRQDHRQVLSGARRVIPRAKRLEAAAVEARAHWLAGMSAFTTNDWSAALDHYTEAIRLCETTREPALASSVRLNTAVLNRFLGNVGATWRYRVDAGRDLPLHRPVQLHAYLQSGAATASTESLPLTALLFQNEVVSNAGRSMPATARAEAAMSRARMLARLGRSAEAERDLEQAAGFLQEAQSEVLRARAFRSWLLASAEVRAQADPSRAARDAGEAVAQIASAGESMRLAEASLLQSRALARLGNLDEARAAAERGIDAFERAVGSIEPTNPIRISALEPVWSLYSDAARLHLQPGREDYPSAFVLLERGRARTLLDLRRVSPLGLTEVQKRLGADEAILLLDQSTSSLVTWWITSQSVRTATTPATLAQVEALVVSHRHSIDRGERRHSSSAELFDLGVRGWWPQLQAARTVVVVPDGPWSRVAWSALWEKSSAVELVSGAAMIMAPSASMALSTRWNRAVPARRAVVVSAANTDNTRALPAARREAKEISAIYSAGRLLEGKDATPGNVLRELTAADIVHVASHAVDVPGHPELSHLVLNGGEAEGRLLVRDIAAHHFPRTRLVVLAACSTAGRRSVRGEGTVGVGWGFLTAGTPHVIATLQDIEDGPAGALFTSVHRGIAAGRTPSEALHDTQRRLAASGESPRVWATVAMFGAL